jgi:ferredoxin
MANTVKVDAKTCIGCGLCVAICPEVFEMGHDGKSHVKNAAACKNSKCKEAAEGCPVQAIIMK